MQVDARDCGVQGVDPPLADLVHIDVERRLIELDDIDPVRRKPARLLVEELGEGKRHLDPVAVVLVGDGVDDGHRAGQGELELVLGVGAGVARFRRMDAGLQAQRAGDGWHHRFVAILADPHLDLAGEIDPFDALQKAVHEMLARLLAVGDDVDTCVFLVLDGEQGRIELCGVELGASQLPGCPQPVRLGEPGRFGQAAGSRGWKHRLPRLFVLQLTRQL